MNKKIFKKRLIIFLLIEGLLLIILVFMALSSLNYKSGLAIDKLLPVLDELHLLENGKNILTNDLYQYGSSLVKRLVAHENLVEMYNKGNDKNPDNNINSDGNYPLTESLKYYQFSLGEASYKSRPSYRKDFDKEIGGIIEDKAGKLSFKRGQEINYGFLRVTNEFYSGTIDIKEMVEKPLFIERKPTILIYHTHTSEGYCMCEDDKNNNESFTSDQEMSVVKAGSIIDSLLNDKYNISSIHDKTVHDEGYNHNIAYDLSKKTIKKNLEENDSIKLSLDIHRDAASVGSQKYGPNIKYEDKEYAQILFVIGSNASSNNPNWQENFKLAMLLIEKLEEEVPGISRGITMRSSPYNQNLVPKGLLVEIGFNGNLIAEVINTSEVFAKVLADVYTYEE